MRHYFISSRTLAFNVDRPLPAALFRKAMKHDGHRRNRFCFVERATRAVSPTYLGSRITLLRIPCDNTVNHADRSGFLRRTLLWPRKKHAYTRWYLSFGDAFLYLAHTKFHGLIMRRDRDRMTDKRYARSRILFVSDEKRYHCFFWYEFRIILSPIIEFGEYIYLN